MSNCTCLRTRVDGGHDVTWSPTCPDHGNDERVRNIGQWFEADIPERVRAAEERRRIRQQLEDLRTPGETAVIKQGEWELGKPGAEPLTEEEQRLAAEKIDRLGRRTHGG